MNDKDMESRLKELLIFMTACATELEGEPQIYGQLRLIDSAKMLAGYLLESDPDNQVLEQFINIVEEDSNKCMTDVDAFQDMLQEATLLLVDL